MMEKALFWLEKADKIERGFYQGNWPYFARIHFRLGNYKEAYKYAKKAEKKIGKTISPLVKDMPEIMEASLEKMKK